MAKFMAEFPPRAISPKQGSLESTHRGEESSGVKSIGIQSAQEDNEVIKEPPQSVKVTIAKKITKVPRVNVKPPQVNLTSAWRMFVDGAKNIIGAGK